MKQDKEREWEATKLEYAQPNSMVDIGEMYWWAHYWHEQCRASVGKGEVNLQDTFNTPTALYISKSVEVTQYHDAVAYMKGSKPVEVGEMMNVIQPHKYTRDIAQAILDRYDVREKV